MFSRCLRQRVVLKTAYEKLRTCGLFTIINTSRDILPNFTTDMTNREIMGYIYTVVTKDMSIAQATYRLPVDECYHSERIRGMSVLVPDLDENAEALRKYLYGIDE